MQDVATAHSAAQGWTFERYLAAGAGWFVRSHYIEYLRPAFLGETLAVHTWVSGFTPRSSPRRYLFVRDADQVPVAQAETLWVFVDFATGRPVRIPGDVEAAFPVVPDDDPELQALRAAGRIVGDRAMPLVRDAGCSAGRRAGQGVEPGGQRVDARGERRRFPAPGRAPRRRARAVPPRRARSCRRSRRRARPRIRERRAGAVRCRRRAGRRSARAPWRTPARRTRAASARGRAASPPAPASPSAATRLSQRDGSARNDGNRERRERAASGRARRRAAASSRSGPDRSTRNAVATGPTATHERCARRAPPGARAPRPRARARGWRARRPVASLGSWIGGPGRRGLRRLDLLDAGEQPARPSRRPAWSGSRSRRAASAGRAVLAQRAGEADAGPVVAALGLRPRAPRRRARRSRSGDARRALSSSRVDLGEHRRRHHVGQHLAVAAVVRRLQADELQLRLRRRTPRRRTRPAAGARTPADGPASRPSPVRPALSRARTGAGCVS